MSPPHKYKSLHIETERTDKRGVRLKYDHLHVTSCKHINEQIRPSSHVKHTTCRVRVRVHNYHKKLLDYSNYNYRYFTSTLILIISLQILVSSSYKSRNVSLKTTFSIQSTNTSLSYTDTVSIDIYMSTDERTTEFRPYLN